MARERRPTNSWPSWFHAPNGDSAVFETLADVPPGWTRQKHTPYVASGPLSVNKEDVISQLVDRGIEIDPTWGAAQLQKVLDNDRSSSR